MDAFTNSFTHLSNSSSSSLDFSFDRLIESSPSDEAQCEMIEQAIRIGGVLVEAGLRATRKRDAEHNSRVWPLNSDLTVNVLYSNFNQFVFVVVVSRFTENTFLLFRGKN